MNKIAPKKTEACSIKDDIQMKMRIAGNIVKACKEEAELTSIGINFYRSNQPLSVRAMAYLGGRIANELLNALNPFIFKKRNRSIREWIESRERNDLTFKLTPSYEKLRSLILRAYLNEHSVPDMTTIQKYCHSDRLSYALMMHGFVWKRYPRTDKCIIVEDPKQIFQRQLYLRKIQECREKNKNIVYVDERNLLLVILTDRYCLDPKAQYSIMAANGNGFCAGVFYDNFEESILPLFLTETLFPDLNEPSVIVLGEKKHNSKNLINKPDQYSSKADMCHWLEANDVPHNPESHRAELYTLIQRCTKHSHVYGNQIDDICRAHGHELVRRPFHLEMLNIFQDFWKFARSIGSFNWKHQRGLPITVSTTSLFEEIDSNIWIKWNMDLITNEIKTYHEDMAMEELLDRIFHMGVNVHLDETRTLQLDCFNSMFGNENFLKNVIF